MSKTVSIPKTQPNSKGATDPALTLARKNQKRINNGSRKKVNRRKKGPRRGNMDGLNSNTRQMIAMNKVHPCVTHYASALMDPQGTPAGACVPWGYPIPSQRVKSFGRGTFALGTTGYGYCYANLVVSNDSTAVVATTATSVGGTSTALNAFTNLNTGNLTKLPFSTAQLATNTTGRLVAYMLRVRYAGTESGRNGIVSTLEQPVSNSQLYAQSYDNFVYETTLKNERPPPDGRWHEIKYTGPTSSALASFNSGSLWAGAGNQAHLIAFIAGAAGDKYEWEVYGHFEYAGENAQGAAMTHVEPEGYGHVLAAAKSVATSQPMSGTNYKSGFAEFARMAGSTVWNLVKSYGMDMAASIISPSLLPVSRGIRMLTN